MVLGVISTLGKKILIELGTNNMNNGNHHRNQEVVFVLFLFFLSCFRKCRLICEDTSQTIQCFNFNK